MNRMNLADDGLAGRNAQAARQRLAARPAGGPTGAVQLTSDELFAGAAEVQIAHEGALYRLKRTALGKLIMTK